MKHLPDYATGSRYSIENRTDTLYRVVHRRGLRCDVIADGVDVGTARLLVREDGERRRTVERWPTRRQREKRLKKRPATAPALVEDKGDERDD